ncbi:MAG: DedA family protein [Candidatus Hydrogenedentes bacterium]|nr:DedA family protein [Candidatus Hydrogenedentota bacterium]
MSDTESAVKAISAEVRKRKNPFTGWLYRLKDWTEGLAEKSYAVPALFALAFAESSFFPIPPDVLLIALCVGKPSKSFYYAVMCTVGSVIGGLAGYLIGYALWHDVATGEYSRLAQLFFHYVPGFSEDRFQMVKGWYNDYNFWVVFTAGFTPIPYKLFTISAGVFRVDLFLFSIASLVGRAGRFFLVSALFYFFGAAIRDFLEKYLEWLTIAFLVMLVGGFAVIKLLL